MRSRYGSGTGNVLLVCLVAGMPSAVWAQDVTQTTTDAPLDTVLVTASKRGEQSLLDTPMSIQAMSASQLEEQGIVQFEDYARQVSGLAFQTQGPGDKKIVLRGLDSTGAATTGVYFDDIVITGNNSQDGGGRQPDIRLVDMERLEVLKGPQGTLYGASSMSGTVRMITNKPDVSGVAAAFNASVGSTKGASGADYSYDAMLNLPLVDDKLAVRVVGYQAEDQGYIDNKFLGIDGVNNQKVSGGRLAARWNVTDTATLDAMYVHQTTSTIGPAWFQAGFGEFVQANHSTTPWHESLDAYNLAFNWSVAKGTVTASVSKVTRDIEYQYPGERIVCSLYGYSKDLCFAFDSEPLQFYRSNAFQPQKRDIVSSEVRYASNWDGPVQMVAGVFYDSEKNDFLSTVYRLDEQMRPMPQREFIEGNRFVHNEVEQKAVFGEVNYSITDALTLTGGVRVFEFDVGQRSQNLPTVTRAAAQPVVVTDSTESSATYKGSIEYQFAAGPLMYFTYSEGFRSGGNNEPDFTTGTHLPPYGSDKLKSYEIGGKGRFFDMLDLDLAVYMMDWEDLQQRISAGIPGSSVQMIANVGSARVKGVEFGARARPFSGINLTLGANVTALENLISTPIPGLNREDDRVPHVPEFTSNVYADYDFPVSSWDGTLHAEYQYVGNSYSDFNELRPIYTPQGDYSLVNLRLNFTRGSYRVGAYVDNVFDEIGVITTTIDQRRPVETYSTRPRSIGVTLGYSF